MSDDDVLLRRIEALGAQVARANADRDEARAEAAMLQDILDSRPAINAGLPETFIRWSQSIYSGDAIRAALSANGGSDER